MVALPALPRPSLLKLASGARYCANALFATTKYKPKLSGNPPYTIVVEGNIGAGKSTFLNKFKDLDSDRIDVLMEPVEKWRNVSGCNLLEQLYTDPVRYSLLFQSYVQLTLLQQQHSHSQKSVKAIERSLFSSHYFFVENLYTEGKLSDVEYAVLSEWHNFLVTIPAYKFRTDLIIYLRTEPEVAYNRVRSRFRHEEAGINFSYIKKLHEFHEEWLLHRTKFQPVLANDVLVIDANEDISEMEFLYAQKGKGILQIAQEKAPEIRS